MAATTAGALKAYIETLGLSLAVYRDKAPEDATGKYVRVHEAVTISPRQSGDFGDPNAGRQVTEEVQLDLFQPIRDANLAVVEDYTLPDTLIRKLHGAHLTAAPKHVYGVRVLNSTRFPDDDENVARQLITVALDRAL